MNLILRTFLVTMRALLASWRGRKLGPFDESVLPFRVWLNDLDVNLHMNNGRYLTIMDLGRFDFLLRSGLWTQVRRQRWMPLVGAVVFRYKRSLQPFVRYDLHSRVLGWDDKWFYIEQRFLLGGELAGLGLVRALFRGRTGNVPPADALRAAGYDVASPPLPEMVADWRRLETAAGVGF